MSDLERLRLEYHEEAGVPNRDDWLPTAPPYIAALEARVADLESDLKYLREVREPGGCQCGDDDACAFARARDTAQKRVTALEAGILAIANGFEPDSPADAARAEAEMREALIALATEKGGPA